MASSAVSEIPSLFNNAMPANVPLEQGGTSSDRSQILWHGSCHHCHHFHISRRIRLPQPDQHLRVFCCRCSRQLFGIGRNSTQISLASVHTSSTLDQDNELPYGNSSGELACIDVPARSDINDRGTALRGDPRDSQVHVRSISPSVGSSVSLRRAQTNTDDTKEASNGLVESEASGGVDGRDRRGRNNSNVLGKKLLKRLKNRLKGGLARSNGLLKHKPLKQDAFTMTEPYPTTSLSSALDVQVDSRSVSRQIQGPLAVHGRHNLRNSLGIEHVSGGATSPSAQKREKLKAQRAEKTLHKRAIQRRKCYCSDNCRCMKGRRDSFMRSRALDTHSNHHDEPSDVDSTRPQPPAFTLIDNEVGSPSTSRSNLADTDVPLVEGHQQRGIVRFAGTHLDPTLRSSSFRSSSIHLEEPRDSHQSTSTGMSQATTLVSSRGSRRGRGRRQTITRTQSLPTIVLHDTASFAEQARPETVEAIRRHDEVFLQASHTQQNTEHVDATDFASLSRQTTQQSSSGVSENAYASATSLSHLAVVGDESQQADQEVTSNGPELADLTLDESDITTPQAGVPVADNQGLPSQPLNEQPDGIIDALEQLSGEDE